MYSWQILKHRRVCACAMVGVGAKLYKWRDSNILSQLCTFARHSNGYFIFALRSAKAGCASGSGVDTFV